MCLHSVCEVRDLHTIIPVIARTLWMQQGGYSTYY